jgi:hypothetical protein
MELLFTINMATSSLINTRLNAGSFTNFGITSESRQAMYEIFQVVMAFW